MNNTIGSVLFSTAAALSLTFVAASGSTFGAIGVGDLAQYTWRAPLVDGLGVTSLEDLRGKPVLIDFWGVR